VEPPVDPPLGVEPPVDPPLGFEDEPVPVELELDGEPPEDDPPVVLGWPDVPVVPPVVGRVEPPLPVPPGCVLPPVVGEPEKPEVPVGLYGIEPPDPVVGGLVPPVDPVPMNPPEADPVPPVGGYVPIAPVQPVGGL
jgi:hypothetical protein